MRYWHTITYILQLRNLVWATSKHDVYLIAHYSVMHWSALTSDKFEVMNVSGHVAPSEVHDFTIELLIQSNAYFFLIPFNMTMSSIFHCDRFKIVTFIVASCSSYWLFPLLQNHPGSLLEGFTQTQVSTLAVKDKLLIAGGFQGELICKVIIFILYLYIFLEFVSFARVLQNSLCMKLLVSTQHMLICFKCPVCSFSVDHKYALW